MVQWGIGRCTGTASDTCSTGRDVVARIDSKGFRTEVVCSDVEVGEDNPLPRTGRPPTYVGLGVFLVVEKYEKVVSPRHPPYLYIAGGRQSLVLWTIGVVMVHRDTREKDVSPRLEFPRDHFSEVENFGPFNLDNSREDSRVQRYS